MVYLKDAYPLFDEVIVTLQVSFTIKPISPEAVVTPSSDYCEFDL